MSNRDRFAHVKDEGLRRTLLGDVSEDSLCIALTITKEAAIADSMDESIDYDIASTRLDLAEQASEAWNERGDMPCALEYLREFWRN